MPGKVVSGDRNRQLVDPSLPSIKIEIRLGQDKGRQTALKRRSQEIKAFLIVPPWASRDQILPDNCLIALGTIGPRCKGASSASMSNNAPLSPIKGEATSFLGYRRAATPSAHDTFCSSWSFLLTFVPLILTSALSLLMSVLLS